MKLGTGLMLVNKLHEIHQRPILGKSQKLKWTNLPPLILGKSQKLKWKNVPPSKTSFCSKQKNEFYVDAGGRRPSNNGFLPRASIVQKLRINLHTSPQKLALELPRDLNFLKLTAYLGSFF